MDKQDQTADPLPLLKGAGEWINRNSSPEHVCGEVSPGFILTWSREPFFVCATGSGSGDGSYDRIQGQGILRLDYIKLKAKISALGA